jgi:hypothetical protein
MGKAATEQEKVRQAKARLRRITTLYPLRTPTQTRRVTIPTGQWPGG